MIPNGSGQTALLALLDKSVKGPVEPTNPADAAQQTTPSGINEQLQLLNNDGQGETDGAGSGSEQPRLPMFHELRSVIAPS